MHTVVLVLVEVLIIIGLSRLMGLLCRFVKQPLVIGEIIAGIYVGAIFVGVGGARCSNYVVSRSDTAVSGCTVAGGANLFHVPHWART